MMYDDKNTYVNSILLEQIDLFLLPLDLSPSLSLFLSLSLYMYRHCVYTPKRKDVICVWSLHIIHYTSDIHTHYGHFTEKS
jgi:hypothetical protein